MNLSVHLSHQIITTTKKQNNMNTEILKTLNLPQSYLTQAEAFEFGTGDNFFPLPDGTMICISENHELFMQLVNAGFKTLLELHMEKHNL